MTEEVLNIKDALLETSLETIERYKEATEIRDKIITKQENLIEKQGEMIKRQQAIIEALKEMCFEEM